MEHLKFNHLNMNILMSQFMDDEQFCIQAIDLFIPSYFTLTQQIDEDIQTHDNDKLIKHLHALKGSLSVFGDVPTFRMLVDAYENGKFGQIEKCIHDYKIIKKYLDAYKDELQTYKNELEKKLKQTA